MTKWSVSAETLSRPKNYFLWSLLPKDCEESATAMVAPQYNEELTEGFEYNGKTIEYISKLEEVITTTKTPWYDYRIDFLTQEVKELKDVIKQLVKKEPAMIKTKIYGLPSDRYELKIPVDVILEIYDDEVLALIPDLELYGEGSNEIESLNDLKLELLDLADTLYGMSDNELGDSPKAWKKTLNQLVTKCQ